MRKVFAIGELAYDTIFRQGKPVDAFMGGHVANAAAVMGQVGLPCCMVGECCDDVVGDLIVGRLTDCHVDVDAVDRFTQGATAMTAVFEDTPQPRVINYGTYPSERFDVVWPRINEDDIVLFGSLYAIDVPQRERFYEFISYAASRHAILMYLPGVEHGMPCQITRVMASLLENMEMAHITMCTQPHLAELFPGETPAEAFRNHIDQSDNTYLHITPGDAVTLYRRDVTESVSNQMPSLENPLGWHAGFVAGVAAMLLKMDIKLADVPAMTVDQWREIMAVALPLACDCGQHGNLPSPELASHLRNSLHQPSPTQE